MANENCTPVVVRTVIDITDPEFFCNKSWTLSYNMNTNSWVSFHTYLPNWYVAENNFFYSGLNTGCDISAIAANLVPYVPTTTTTTTPNPYTTTTTSTTTLDCELEPGPITLLDCTLIAASALKPTTTTTSTSSTTTTTTTICPGCSTYQVVNDTSDVNSIDWKLCSGDGVTIDFPAHYTMNLCACEEPLPVSGFIISLVASGVCATCFCYTFTNTTIGTLSVYWADCDGISQSASLDGGKSMCVCASQGSCYGPTGITISGGTSACSTGDECGIPSTPGVITATELTGCSEITYDISIPELPAGATSIQWILPSGMVILSETETGIIVSVSSSGSIGTIIVYGVNDCGVSAPSTLSISIPACSTTTTTTTIAIDCYCYTIETVNNYTIYWTNCFGSPESFNMGEIVTLEICAIQDSVYHSAGSGSITITQGDLCVDNVCPTTTTTTTLPPP